jgi:hypothetical protein
MRVLFIFILCFVVSNIQAEEHDHGFVNESPSGKLLVWNNTENEWNSIELFWKNFIETNKATSWGWTDEYPNYNDVNEFDTLVITLKEGPCLMQFYHSRWRRANDVQRWDDAFNEYGGCPYVFD